ncbi:MAG TPA: citrate (Si)-synthase [Anaerolineaceae bacterium]
MNIKHKIAAKLPAAREQAAKLVKEHGTFKIADVTIEQIYGGIRGVPIQISDVSFIDPKDGIRLRGYSIPEVIQKLPKPERGEYPLVGGLYYLLMTGDIPTQSEAEEVEIEWKVRNNLPDHVFQVLRAMPKYTHPMTLFSQAILALQTESIFARRYYYGIDKKDYWDIYLQDSLNLTAKLPIIAANIYNLKYRDGVFVHPDPNLDWGANFAYMLGKNDDMYQDLCRLFLVLHSDHEGANVSAHASHLVGSALSDVYFSSSAGMNGLAGPLHGLANQECLRWLLEVYRHFKGLPSREQLEAYLEESLNAGELIPGYGHAVLRVTDPRFTAQAEFAKKYLPDDELFRLVMLVFDTLPPLLIKQGKARNPWPNVDAINGSLQYHFGLKEFDFYTVVFGLSRILGLTTHITWSRALGRPIERPKSLTTKILEGMVDGV